MHGAGDREGENICFEVLSILRGAGHFMDDGAVYRARFSALTPPALLAACATHSRFSIDNYVFNLDQPGL